IYAAWRKISAYGDTDNGGESSGSDRKDRQCIHDELRVRSLSVQLESVSRSSLCSYRIYCQDCCFGRRLQEDPFYIPGVLPSYVRRSETLEPAFCRTSRCICCSDWIRTSFDRRKGQYVGN